MNDTVHVAAPSGGAAYNVGGCTLHRCLNLQVDAKELSTPLKDEKQDELKEKLQHLLMLVIDEQSMISSGLLGTAERNIRHCVYGGQNQTELWGGVPVILIFGNDYQLFPVAEEGAIYGYSKKQQQWNQTSTTTKSQHQLLIDNVNHLFIDTLTSDVFELTENYRTKADPEKGVILQRLRTGHSTINDAERFIKLCLHHHNQNKNSWRHKLEKHPKTIFLYTQNF